MQSRLNPFTALCWFAIVFLTVPFLASAQTASIVAPRIAQAVDETRLTVLRGNTHPLARAGFDRGEAPSGLPMQRMLLVLKRGPEQEAALEALLAQQQDKSSPNYHQWLTPQQFGLQFGPADQDIQTIVSWLQGQGFQISRISTGRTVIEFSGVASQVQQAFHTAIHRYVVNGEGHWANSTDPQIPEALAPVVAGVLALNNFPRQAMHHIVGAFSRSKDTGELTPLLPSFTLGGQCGVPGIGCHGVSPYDFATIYNVLPLWNASPTHIDGTGQTIAIVGESDITLQDISDFRTFFGLPPANLQIIHDGSDPGIVPGDETESTLDVEWAGAVAKNATIDFVVSQTTEASLGVDLSAEYIVDNDLAPILSESYGACERFLGTAGNQFYNQLWQQAAAQGITVLVATGDSGSAVCDQDQAPAPSPATHGLAVSGFSSTPYNVAVGGTDFNDLTNSSSYWSATNFVPSGSPAGTPATVSALSYIPEATWNSSCTNTQALALLGFSGGAEADCNNSQLVNLVVSIGGSGGKSNCTAYDTTTGCTGSYPKPAWQTALTPSDGARDVPDVSLFAAAGAPSGSFYVICEADLGSASCNPASPDAQFIGVGGTSASTPAFAGIMALVDQKAGATQGNANYVLYKLAAKQPSAFNDVTAGTIAMPCATGSTPDCVTSRTGDAYGVLSGYPATTGYDLATGLGSVNANTLVNAWATADTALEASATTLTLNGGNPVNIIHGQSVNFSINTTAAPPGTGTPTGNVALVANVTPPGSPSEVTRQNVQGFALTNGLVSSSTNLLPGGSYTVFAQYSGDGTFAGSESSPPVSVTVAPEPSLTAMAFELFNPTTGALINPSATSAPFGSASLLRVNVTSESGDTCALNARGQSGCPTGSLTLTDNSVSLDSGTYTLNSQGYAEDQAIQLSTGSHSLKAVYAGDNSFTGSTGSDLISITPAPTTIAVQGPFSTSYLNVPLFVIVSTHSTAIQTPPTGTVQFFVGGAPLGTPVPVVGGSNAGFAQATLNFSPGLPIGLDSITVQYNGDANYLPSPMSSPISIQVLANTTTTLTASTGAVIPQGQSVTFTAQVQVEPGATGGPAPTGTVQFSSNGSNLGGPIALSNGRAQLTTSSLQPGVDNIEAVYSGDANNGGSNSPLFAMTVNPPFTISANPMTISIAAPGQSGSTMVTFTSQNSFSSNGNVNLTPSACSGLPAGSACSFSPSVINLAPNGTATTTFTISTTASSSALLRPRSHGDDDFDGWNVGRIIPIGYGVCLGMLLLGFGRRGQQRWNPVFVLVFAMLLADIGCGGGGGNSGGIESRNPGTPVGYSLVTVTVTINGFTETLSNMAVSVQ